MVRVPPALTPGDTIALTCPAGYMSKEKVETCVQTLEAWGYRVVVGKRVGSSSSNYFSGTDKERGKEFQQFLDDPKVQAILCARGGYGMSRIIDQLHFRNFRKQPKWIIGFSDITVLHSHLYAKYGIASL
ncbi:MAG: LD-carboxypeptidase, partial [Chitinophagaceae bacterium]